jgi:hypothetical protein
MPASIEHWFDFTCPYCYLAQDRDRSGRYRGRPTDGPAVRILAEEAATAGLPLRWQDRIPSSRRRS